MSDTDVDRLEAVRTLGEARLRRAMEWFAWDDGMRDRVAAVILDGLSHDEAKRAIARIRADAARNSHDLERRYCEDTAIRMERLLADRARHDDPGPPPRRATPDRAG